MEVSTVIVLLLIASAFPGCNAEISGFSLFFGNCQPFGVVSATTGTTFSIGTVCGNVNKETADYICDYLNMGNATNYGTAGSKGVPGGSGVIEVKDLSCTRNGGCSYSTSTGDCTHSQDLVIQCSLESYLCFPVAAIVAIIVAAIIFCIIIPVIACIACCVCACLGVACFRRKTPNYSQL